jgi:hypothetical protein
MAQFFLGNETATGDLLSLGDASFVESDGAAITMTIVETDRISAVEQSATPGGDGSSLIVDVLANAVFDLATNPSVASLNLVVTELPDIIPPFITGASLNYDVGMITFTTSERIDVTPSSGIDMSKIFIANTNGGNTIALNAAQLQTANDATTVSIKISEASRALAIAISAMPGGDGVTAFLDVSAAFMHDIGLVNNLLQNGIVLSETPDITPPNFVSGTISYDDSISSGGRRIILTLSETIDLTPISLVNISCFMLSENGVDVIVIFVGATATGIVGLSLCIEMRV